MSFNIFSYFTITLLESSLGKTLPLICKVTIGVSTALEVIVMVLRIGPTRLVSYFTTISSLSPGAIGPSGFEEVVHPHVVFTLLITNGSSPVLVKVKVQD